jgi:hypothetical protein
MQDGGDDDPSVLPDRDFVQMSGVAQNKFRLGVACRLHIPHREDPKPEQPEVKSPSRHKQVTHKNHLPLTAINTARFNPRARSAKVGAVLPDKRLRLSRDRAPKHCVLELDRFVP